jgi:hypothetical protein
MSLPTTAKKLSNGGQKPGRLLVDLSIQKFISFLLKNTTYLHYKGRPVNSVSGNNFSLFGELHNTSTLYSSCNVPSRCPHSCHCDLEANIFFPLAKQPNAGQGYLILELSKSHTQRHTTVGMTPPYEGSVCHRDLYLTNHNRQPSMTRRDSNPQSL